MAENNMLAAFSGTFLFTSAPAHSNPRILSDWSLSSLWVHFHLNVVVQRPFPCSVNCALCKKEYRGVVKSEEMSMAHIIAANIREPLRIKLY